MSSSSWWSLWPFTSSSVEQQEQVSGPAISPPAVKPQDGSATTTSIITIMPIQPLSEAHLARLQEVGQNKSKYLHHVTDAQLSRYEAPRPTDLWCTWLNRAPKLQQFLQRFND